MDELGYSSATIHYLDRDNNQIKKVMSYPITKVELQEFTGETVKVVRTFVVAGNKWQEVQ